MGSALLPSIHQRSITNGFTMQSSRNYHQYVYPALIKEVSSTGSPCTRQGSGLLLINVSILIWLIKFALLSLQIFTEVILFIINMKTLCKNLVGDMLVNFIELHK